MKICTACNATYSDDTLTFCPVDGTTLTPRKDISIDQVPFSYESSSWSDIETSTSSQAGSFTNSEPPIIADTFYEPPPAPQNFSPAPQSKHRQSSMFPLVVTGSIILAVVAGALMMAISGNSGDDYPEVRVNSGVSLRVANITSVNAARSNAAVTTAQDYTNSAPANNSSNIEAGKMTSKPISRKTDFTGIWKGKFNEMPATLSITTQKDDTFSGTLSKNGYVVKLIGKINFAKGTVSITETEVLQTPSSSKWNLGTDDGIVSNGGKSMNGTGRDKNGSYSWSFTKD
jgi:hypothetical protein